YRSISPSLSVATDATHGPHHVLDRVGACERAWQLCRQSEAIDSQHFIEPCKDAGSDTGRLLVEPAGEITQQALRFVGIVEFPSLPECPAHRRMQWLGQSLDHIAGLM